jgi:small subunit ribosomal protein S3Ae
MAAKKSSVLKKIKKKWIPITASKEFSGAELGETYVTENEQVLGKVVCANLMNLTRDAKKQNVQAYFIVTEYKDGHAQTELIGYEIVPAYIKRVTKKAEERVDYSFDAVSQDNVKFRIKPILMTKGIAHKSVATSLRKATENYIKGFAAKTSFSEIMKSIISGNLQKDLKMDVKKVYPLNFCLIKEVRKAAH